MVFDMPAMRFDPTSDRRNSLAVMDVPITLPLFRHQRKLELRDLVDRSTSPRLSRRTKIVSVGAKLVQQILRFLENLCFLRFTDQQNNVIIAPGTHVEDEWILLTKSVPADVSVLYS